MSEPTPYQPDLPPPPPAPELEAASPAPPRARPRRLLVSAILAALALVAGIAVAWTLGGRGNQAEARPLALSFTPGDRETYELHLAMDGTLGAGELGEMPFDMDLREVLTWEVTDVDAEGVATIEVAVSEVSGSVNGIEVPTDPSQPPSLQMRVAPDGRVLEVGGLSFAGTDPSSGLSFPGMGQMTPLLPDHPVAPGDRWTTSFSQANPFGEGEISYETTSTFLREEELDGVRTAVIRSEMTIPLDLTISLDEMLAAMGGDVGGSRDAEGLRGLEIAYDGEGSLTQTAWVDLDAQQALKIVSSGTFDMTVAVSGPDGLEELGDLGQGITFRGDLTQELRRR